METICYNKIEYFKSSLDYKDERYFTCINYNKKSKINIGKKMCNGKIKLINSNENGND